MLKKIKQTMAKKKNLLAILPLLVIAGIFLFTPAAHAGIEDWPVKVIGGILSILISAVGLILVLVIKALVYVASYSNFINSGAVTYGWIMVRDICNMFFIVILLIIAFGTILNIDSYNYKKWLPKLIMMAVLINFSKTICGLLIDVAQVIMLTFVNAFKDIGGANITTILGIDSILQMDKASPDQGFWTIIGAYLLGFIYVVIALIVMVTMTVMLVMRIVMIWIYVVLSPLAYLLAAFPGGQSYSSRWWSDFTKNLIVGPVLAFFIWLSLAALNADGIRDAQEMAAIDQAAEGELSNMTASSSENVAVIGTKSSTPSALIKFIIAIGMLLGGLKIAQEVGGAAGAIAGKGSAAVSRAGKIGMAGVAGATGYTYAKNVGKNYMAMRQARKAASYQLGAEKLAGGIGAAKKYVGTNLNQAADWTKNRVGLNRSGKKAKNLTQEAQERRQQADIMQQNLNRKDGKINDWEYDKVAEKWKNTTNPAQVRSHEEMEQEVNKDAQNLTHEADVRDRLASIHMMKQKRQDKWMKAGLITAGVGFGLLTGGAGFSAPLVGAAMAGGGIAGLYKGKNKLSTMGDYDLAKGSSWRMNKVKTAKEDMKEDTDQDVIAKMDDQSMDEFGRAAAAMEAMSRGLLTSSQAQARKEQMKKEIGTDKNGDIKDKKIANAFEAIAQTKNISATKKFEDLRSRDPKKKEEAERSVVKDIESGRISLDSLDAGAIKQISGSLTSFMKTKDFATQFSAIKDQNKKNEITKIMKDEASVDTDIMPVSTEGERIAKSNAEFKKLEAMKKLTRTKDLKFAVPDPVGGTPAQIAKAQENREKILSEFSYNELSDVFSGNDKKQQQAIIDAVSNSANRTTMFETANRSLMGTSPQAKSLRTTLGIPHPVVPPAPNRGQNNQANANAGAGTTGGAGAAGGAGTTTGTTGGTGNSGSYSGPGIPPPPGPTPSGQTWNGFMWVPITGFGGGSRPRPNTTQNTRPQPQGPNNAAPGNGGAPLNPIA